MIDVHEALVVLGTLEIRQHLRIAPTCRTTRRPVIVVAGVPARVDLRVDAGAATEHLGLRIAQLPRWRWGTVENPQAAMPLVIFANPAGIANSGLLSLPPAFQQEHLDRWVDAQTIGAVDWYAMSEDLPSAESRVTVDGANIQLDCLSALKPCLDVDTGGQRKRVEADLFEALPYRGDGRLVRNRAQRIRCRVNRLRRIQSERTAHVIKLLRSGVPRLQFVVAEQPARRRSFAVRDRGKVFSAIADQYRAVELGVAANVVVVAGIEGLPCPVEPGLLRPENTALEDRSSVARRLAVPKALAALQN